MLGRNPEDRDRSAKFMNKLTLPYFRPGPPLPSTTQHVITSDMGTFQFFGGSACPQLRFFSSSSSGYCLFAPFLPLPHNVGLRSLQGSTFYRCSFFMLHRKQS